MTITIEQARALYADADPVHDFAHVLRVLAMAERLAQLEGADLDIVRTAALLHDIARTDDGNADQGFAMQARPEDDHALMAARQARHLLAGSPAAFVDAVAHAIEAHRYRNAIEPRSIEARVLFDADKLDSIGAIGVARAFSFAGMHAMPLWAPVSAGYIPGQSGEPHTAVHEFYVKLQHVRDRLYTRSGRQIADARHRFMVAFFEQLNAEVGGQR